MGWKKEYKKMLKEEAKQRFNSYDNEISDYHIDWKFNDVNPGAYTLDFIETSIKQYTSKINNLLSNLVTPHAMENDFTWEFNKLGYSEKYISQPAVTFFEQSKIELVGKVADYGTAIIRLSLLKFEYFIFDKFIDIVNKLFKKEDILDNHRLVRVYEIIKRTTLEQYEDIIYEACLSLQPRGSFDSKKNHLTISEIVESGSNFVYHWSKMLEQICEITLEEIAYQQKYQSNSYNKEENYDSYQQTYNYDKDFEETKTIVISNDLNKALDFFKLQQTDSYETFKKAYRAFAKMYHPDVNGDPRAHQLMKTANIYKYVLEEHFKMYN